MILAQLWLSHAMAQADMDQKTISQPVAPSKDACLRDMRAFGDPKPLYEEAQDFFASLKSIRVVNKVRRIGWENKQGTRLERADVLNTGERRDRHAPAAAVLSGAAVVARYANLYRKTVHLNLLLAVYKGFETSPVTNLVSKLVGLRSDLAKFEQWDELRKHLEAKDLNDDLSPFLNAGQMGELEYRIKLGRQRPYSEFLHSLVQNGWISADGEDHPTILKLSLQSLPNTWPAMHKVHAELDRLTFAAQVKLADAATTISDRIGAVMDLLELTRIKRENFGGLPLVSGAEEDQLHVKLGKLKHLRDLELIVRSGLVKSEKFAAHVAAEIAQGLD